MKLACVVQRYGPEVTGGSETHCRHVAQRLAEHHQVDVLTSTARDYVLWRNTYEPGWSTDGPVRVGRFRVTRERRLAALKELTDRVLERNPSEADQVEWFRRNGPEVPDLITHLGAHGRDYDLILFWTFRYFPSFFGLPLVADRAVLVPTAEEDPILDLPVLKDYFSKPQGYIFLTEEERILVAARAGGTLPPSVVVGTGLEPRTPPAGSARGPADVPDPFLLYVGRVDVNKGCDTLLRYFSRFVAEGGPAVDLVLAGPVQMPVEPSPRVHMLGYVDDDTRGALLDRALSFVMPSRYESLSIAVLKGQVRRANGGLYYSTYREFAEAVSLMIDRPASARRMGQQGLAWVEAEYRWPTVLGRIESLLKSLHR